MKLSKDEIETLRDAVKDLSQPNDPEGLLGSAQSLANLCNRDKNFTIDFASTESVGAPVIIASASKMSSHLLLQLTPRQQQVAQHIARGASNKTIAHELNIQLGTVKDHVHAILEKLNLQSRNELTALLLSDVA